MRKNICRMEKKTYAEWMMDWSIKYYYRKDRCDMGPYKFEIFKNKLIVTIFKIK